MRISPTQFSPSCILTCNVWTGLVHLTEQIRVQKSDLPRPAVWPAARWTGVLHCRRILNKKFQVHWTEKKSCNSSINSAYEILTEEMSEAALQSTEVWFDGGGSTCLGSFIVVHSVQFGHYSKIRKNVARNYNGNKDDRCFM